MRDLTGASAEIVVIGGRKRNSSTCSPNNSNSKTSSSSRCSSRSSSTSSCSDSPESSITACKRPRRSRRGSTAAAAAAAAIIDTTTTTTTTTTTSAAATATAAASTAASGSGGGGGGQASEARMEQQQFHHASTAGGGGQTSEDSMEQQQRQNDDTSTPAVVAAATPGFVECLRRIIDSDDPQVVSEAWNSLDEMENLESGSQNATYDCNRHYDQILRDLLTKDRVRNITEVPRLLDWFSKFPFPSTAPISDDIACFLVASAKDFTEKPCLAEIIEVLESNHMKYLSPHNNHSDLWEGIVEVLSCYKVPEEPAETKKYNKDLQTIFQFLKKRKEIETGENSFVFKCFKKLRSILLTPSFKPSPALIIILQLIDDKLWSEHMDVVVKQVIEEIGDNGINQMLMKICYWLILPPFTYVKYLSRWLILFMKALINWEKPRVVMDVTDEVLPNILSKCLRITKFNEIDPEYNIIYFMLHQISNLEILHKVMPIIGDYLMENNKVAAKDLEVKKNVIEITVIVYKRFERHVIINSPCPCTKTKNIIYEYTKENRSLYVTQEKQDMEISYPSTSTGIGRMDSGKVGLRNLGNTCYMNSVLQALVMTRQFCHEVLLYKSKNDLSDQTVLKNLQNLFALLKYSEKVNLAPTEILRTSRPAYFMPGQQQDSSEFLCHLLDVMYEQEKAALMKNTNSDQNTSTKSKIEDKEMTDIEEIVGTSDSPLNDDGTPKTIARWTTEENLSEGVSLQRKTQSLADFTQGEELAQTQNGLSDSHSDSTDSGIQSVGGEDSSSSSTATNSSSYLVQRVFGGELKVTYQCMQCSTESHNTDQFRDLQLCFLDVDTMPPNHAIKVQDLINSNYSMPESLTGDNKYRCDSCQSLCDAQRIIKILQAPAHLILTLKHFRYDSESRLRTKLRRKVIYDETIQLPVLNEDNETYQLYAAVVHSGYSMDYGHYITYACDAKNQWYKFNDSFVTQTTLEDFKSLQPPDTPYILFYRRCGRHKEPDEDAPDIASLSKKLQDYVEQEKRGQTEERRVTRHSLSGNTVRYNQNFWDKEDDDEDNPPSSKCGDAVNIPNPQFLC